MIRNLSKITLLTLSLTSLSLESSSAFSLFGPEKRTEIHVVGSSTVSPFMSAISEEFSRLQNLKNIPTKTPTVESTGTKEGLKQFCAGVGYDYPDFANASRPIRQKDIVNCSKNGIKEIGEIKLGYDGIVIGNSVGGKKIKLTKEQIFLALAAKVIDQKTGQLIDNPYSKWSDIDAKLPKNEILFYGPPLTSGTRDVFVEMVMEDVCFTNADLINAYKDESLRKHSCVAIRTDGKFVESGENDNLIIQNLKNNPHALGIIGFNFLIVNSKVIQAVKVDNVLPSFDTITSKKYELSRPLFVYFKREHLDLIPDMRDFIKEIISADTIGHNGYLYNSGLVALSDSELREVRRETLSQL